MNTTTATAKVSRPVVGQCLRCGRDLRNASTDGYGPKCRAMYRKAAKAEAIAQYKPHQVAKAVELIEQGGMVRLRNLVFLAASSDGSAVYRTHPAACNCPAGLKGRHACKHQIAAHVLALTLAA